MRIWNQALGDAVPGCRGALATLHARSILNISYLDKKKHSKDVTRLDEGWPKRVEEQILPALMIMLRL